MVFNANSNMTCKSKNIIFCMTCDGCGENYYGQTGTKLDDHVRVHRQQIRHSSVSNTPCSEHFDMCMIDQFEIILFYKRTIFKK